MELAPDALRTPVMLATGQDSNGDMHVVRMDGSRRVIAAAPEEVTSRLDDHNLRLVAVVEALEHVRAEVERLGETLRAILARQRGTGLEPGGSEVMRSLAILHERLDRLEQRGGVALRSAGPTATLAALFERGAKFLRGPEPSAPLDGLPPIERVEREPGP